MKLVVLILVLKCAFAVKGCSLIISKQSPVIDSTLPNLKAPSLQSSVTGASSSHQKMSTAISNTSSSLDPMTSILPNSLAAQTEPLRFTGPAQATNQNCAPPNLSNAIAVWPMDNNSRVLDIVRNIALNTGGSREQFYSGTGPFGLRNTSLINSVGLSRMCGETALMVATTSFWIGFFVRTSFVTTGGNTYWPVLSIIDNGVNIVISLDRENSFSAAQLYLGCKDSKCFSPLLTIPYEQWVFVAISFSSASGSFSITTSTDNAFMTFRSIQLSFIPQLMAGWANTAKLSVGRGFIEGSIIDGMNSNDAIACLGVYSASLDIADYIAFCACYLSKETRSQTTVMPSTLSTAINPGTTQPSQVCNAINLGSAIGIWPLNSVTNTTDIVNNITFNGGVNTFPTIYSEGGPFNVPGTAMSVAKFKTNIAGDTPLRSSSTASFWFGFFVRTIYLSNQNYWPVVQIYDGQSGRGVKFSITVERSISSSFAQVGVSCKDGLCTMPLLNIPYNQWVFVAVGFSAIENKLTMAVSTNSAYTQFQFAYVFVTSAIITGWSNAAVLLVGRGYSRVSNYFDGQYPSDTIACLGIYKISWIDPANYASFCNCGLSAYTTTSSTTTTTTPVAIWWRCISNNTCQAQCRSASSSTSSPCLPWEFPEVTPSPFGTSLQNCNNGTIDYPIGRLIYYGKDEDRRWTMQTCASKRFRFSLFYADLDQQDNYDFVYLHNGASISSPRLLIFGKTGVGNIIPPQIVEANETIIMLRFSSDNDYESLGFTMNYTVISN